MLFRSKDPSAVADAVNGTWRIVTTGDSWSIYRTWCRNNSNNNRPGKKRRKIWRKKRRALRTGSWSDAISNPLLTNSATGTGIERKRKRKWKKRRVRGEAFGTASSSWSSNVGCPDEDSIVYWLINQVFHFVITIASIHSLTRQLLYVFYLFCYFFECFFFFFFVIGAKLH